MYIILHLVIIQENKSAFWHLVAKLLKSLPRNHPLLSTLFYLQAAPGRIEDLRTPGALKFYRGKIFIAPSLFSHFYWGAY